MKIVHKLNRRLVASVLLLSLVLQSCSNFSNTAFPRGKKSTKTTPVLNNSGIKQLVDKELTSEGGHIVTFHEQDGSLKANVTIAGTEDSNRPFICSGVPVYIERDIEEIPQETKITKRLIHVNLPKNGQQGRVEIYKQGLNGGGKKKGKNTKNIERVPDTLTTGNQEEEEEEEEANVQTTVTTPSTLHTEEEERNNTTKRKSEFLLTTTTSSTHTDTLKNPSKRPKRESDPATSATIAPTITAAIGTATSATIAPITTAVIVPPLPMELWAIIISSLNHDEIVVMHQICRSFRDYIIELITEKQKWVINETINFSQLIKSASSNLNEDKLVIKEVPPIKSLCTSIHPFQFYYLLRNIYNLPIPFLASLVTCKNLQQLIWENDGVRDEDVGPIIKALQCGVITLDLMVNNITNSGAIELAKNLHGTNLNTLILCGNPIGDIGCIALAQAWHNTTGKIIDLQGTDITTVAKDLLRQHYSNITFRF